MMNSWLRNFLPKDEYKEKLYLYFLAEGMVVFFLLSVIMLFVQPQLEQDVTWTFLIPLISFIFYVYGRYILSGVEYTDIMTEQEYKNEIRTIFKKSVTLAILFLALTLIMHIPRLPNDFNEYMALAFLAGLLNFIVQYVSLKRSYRKNKELVD